MEEVKGEETDAFQELFHDRIRMTRQLQYIEANILSADTLGRKVGINVDRRPSLQSSNEFGSGAQHNSKTKSLVMPPLKRSLLDEKTQAADYK